MSIHLSIRPYLNPHNPYTPTLLNQGNFVWKKEVGGVDPWLASLENEEDLEARIGEAALARKKRWVVVVM